MHLSRRSLPALWLLATFSPLPAPALAAPSTADWSTLSSAVQGRLHTAEPLARPCFSVYNGQSAALDADQCGIVQANYLNASFRTSLYPGVYHNTNEACSSDVANQCLLDPANPEVKIEATADCRQGILSERYIEVRSAKDVQAAITFSRRTRIPLSIKASGHDFMARSTRKGSLALWTRNLKDMQFHAAFTPSGCRATAQGYRAITVGTGANVEEIGNFVDAHASTFVGGSSSTVTGAGGFSLFGGHGVLSPTYGLGADRVLEFKVVTGDGVLRTVNACREPGLFKALAGAGAGAYGVVLSATVKVEPLFPVSYALMSYTPSGVQEQVEFMQILTNATAALSKEGWGGPMGPAFISLVNPKRGNITSATKAMAPLQDYVAKKNGTVQFLTFPSYNVFYKKFISGSPDTSFSTSPFLTFRTVPKAFHDDVAQHPELGDFLEDLVTEGFTPTLFLTPPANAPIPALSSVHPAWRDAYWLLGTQVGYGWNATLDERKDVTGKIQGVTTKLEKLSPGHAFYPNEGSPFTKNWQEGFWGKAYGDLVNIKKQYDPWNLFNCWKCVGFDESTFGQGNCLGVFQL